MSVILAIETATDACSVALLDGEEVVVRHEVAARQHNQLLFGMIADLVPDGDFAALGVQAIAYGCGPGSFTGLRIAASAVQGMCFSAGLPAIPVSTLAALAQGALREGLTESRDRVLCTLDARINEVYSAVCTYSDGFALIQEGPWALPPAQHTIDSSTPLRAVGNGCQFLSDFDSELRNAIQVADASLLPNARDVALLAGQALARGELQQAADVSPIYVRDEISWKKVAEQGPAR